MIDQETLSKLLDDYKAGRVSKTEVLQKAEKKKRNGRPKGSKTKSLKETKEKRYLLFIGAWIEHAYYWPKGKSDLKGILCGLLRVGDSEIGRMVTRYNKEIGSVYFLTDRRETSAQRMGWLFLSVLAETKW